MSNKDLLRQPEAITPSFLITKRRYGVRKGGVTLIEILIVIIIIGILVTLALPNFGTMRERALDKEARANLKLIQAAQRIYRMENNFYYPVTGSADTDAINTNLRLFLSATNWGYSIEDAATTATTLDARTTRNSPPAPASWVRNYRIDHDDEEACCCSTESPTPCLSTEQCASCP